MTKLRYYSFYELRKQSNQENIEFDSIEMPEPIPGMWERILDRFFPNRQVAIQKLKEENNNLRSKLLATLRSGEDAGRIGLQLYEENEHYRNKTALDMLDEEALARRDAELIDLRNKNKRLERDLRAMTEMYNRLSQDVNEWIVKFGEEK